MTHCTTSALLTTPEKVPANNSARGTTTVSGSSAASQATPSGWKVFSDLAAQLRFRPVAAGALAWLDEAQVTDLREQFHRTWFKTSHLDQTGHDQEDLQPSAAAHGAKRTSITPHYSRLRSTS